MQGNAVNLLKVTLTLGLSSRLFLCFTISNAIKIKTMMKTRVPLTAPPTVGINDAPPLISITAIKNLVADCKYP